MNKNTINKLKFFLSGINTRIEENYDFILEIEVLFTSGLKTFKANAVPTEDLKFNWNYKGITKETSPSILLDEILKECEKYDSITFLLKERGTVMELKGDDRDIKVRNLKVEDTMKDKGHNNETSTLLNRKYLINHETAAPLLKELGILTKDGKIRNDKIRKYNQIDHYVEILEKELDRFQGKRIHIVDCGCGKSYLSFVLNHYLTEVKKIKCFITGIDISPKVIEASKKMAENLGYRNMKFIVGDIKNLILDDHPNIVMSLHACDTATDLAMNFALRNSSELIIAVPCCHAEMNQKYSIDDFSSILKHGILKRRMADVLTDGLRALILESEGYDVVVNEYISPLETPKNIMIKAIRTGKKNKASEDELMKLILKFNYAPALYRLLNGLED